MQDGGGLIFDGRLEVVIVRRSLACFMSERLRAVARDLSKMEKLPGRAQRNGGSNQRNPTGVPDALVHQTHRMHRHCFARPQPWRGFISPYAAKRRGGEGQSPGRQFIGSEEDGEERAGFVEYRYDLPLPETGFLPQPVPLDGTGAAWSAQLPALGEVLRVSLLQQAIVHTTGFTPWPRPARCESDDVQDGDGCCFSTMSRWV